MKKVSKETFEKIIYKLDVTYTPVGNYPYDDRFAFRNGNIAGVRKGGEGYFVSDELYKKNANQK